MVGGGGGVGWGAEGGVWVGADFLIVQTEYRVQLLANLVPEDRETSGQGLGHSDSEGTPG